MSRTAPAPAAPILTAPTRIAPARPQDLDALAALEAAATPHPYTRAQLAEELTLPQSHLDTLWVGNALAAHLCTWWVTDEWHVLTLATDPAHRRKGHARALMHHAAAQARAGGLTTALLEVRVGNAGAQALYALLGFQRVGLRRNYYSDGEDAVLMTAAVRDVLAAGGA